jgi:hypothetical protein
MEYAKVIYEQDGICNSKQNKTIMFRFIEGTNKAARYLTLMTNPTTLSRINERDPLLVSPVNSSTRAIDTHSLIHLIIHLCLGLSFKRQQTDNQGHSCLLYKPVVYTTIILLYGIQFL